MVELEAEILRRRKAPRLRMTWTFGLQWERRAVHAPFDHKSEKNRSPVLRKSRAKARRMGVRGIQEKAHPSLRLPATGKLGMTMLLARLRRRPLQK
jgi:hypothetical protein